MSRENEPRQSLVRRDPAASPPRVVYRGQLRTVNPRYDPVARWYERADTWGEKIRKILTGTIDEPPTEKPEAELRLAVLIAGLLGKLVRVLLLAVWACAYVLWQRIKQMGGHH